MYTYKQRAHVPEGIDREILPAAADAQVQVSDAQVDQPETGSDRVEDRPFEAGGHFIKRRRRVRRMTYVRQIDEMDCGAASLAMIARHFGRARPAGAHPPVGQHRPRRHQPAIVV